MTNLEILNELNVILEKCCFAGDDVNGDEVEVRCLPNKADQLTRHIFELSQKLSN